MKRITPYIVSILFMLVLAACGGQPETPPTLPPPATSEVAPTDAPTDIPPTATVPPVATEETPPTEEAAAPVAPGICAQFDPTLLELNTQGLAAEWQANCVPGTEAGADGPMLSGLPEHVQINFGNLSPSSRQPGDPVLYIIPAAAYRAQWDEAGVPLVGEQLDALSDLIARAPNAVRPRGMPVLPLEEAGATNDLAVQGRALDFGTWSGIRFAGRFSQGPTPITNDNLHYIFQGFAGDNDEFFVAFFYPVTTPNLPLTAEEVTPESIALLESDPIGYFDEQAAALNALTSADWQPDLDLLDELIGSLTYGGDESSTEAEVIDPDNGGRPSSYAIVTGAAGVNVRSGPSTAFTSLGVAPLGAQLELVGRSVDGNWWVTPIAGAPNGRGWVSASFVDAFNVNALPVIGAPPLPTPIPATATPTPEPANPFISFWSDRGTIDQGQCTTLRWSVANIQAVWVYEVGENFERFPATGDGSRSVCPAQTTTYEMRVQLRDGSIVTRQVTVVVNPGNVLAGSRWVLAAFGNGQPILPGQPPTLQLNVGNNAQGFGGCNSFSAAYSVNGPSQVAISVSSRGFKTCGEELDAQENLFLDSLNRTTAFDLSGNQLTLRDAAGQELLRLIGR